MSYHLALVIALAGCGGIHVRMAEHEDVVTELQRQPQRAWAEECLTHGKPAPHLRHAVITTRFRSSYARRFRRCCLANTIVASHDELAATPTPDGLRTVLIIEPYTEVGKLQVLQQELDNGRSTWGEAHFYCLHIRRDGQLILVEPVGFVIGLQTLGDSCGFSSSVATLECDKPLISLG